MARSKDRIGSFGNRVGLRGDFGSDRFELGSQPLADRVELRVSGVEPHVRGVELRVRGVELRVGFLELHSEARVNAVHFCCELGVHLPDLNAENCKARDDHDQQGDYNEAESSDDQLKLPS
jgi:hypothetical protein